MSLVRTSFNGFNFTGRRALFSPTSPSKAGEFGTETGTFNFFTALAALRFLRDGRTRVRPDLVVVGFEEVWWLWEEEDKERDPSIGLCAQVSFCPQSCWLICLLSNLRLARDQKRILHSYTTTTKLVLRRGTCQEYIIQHFVDGIRLPQWIVDVTEEVWRINTGSSINNGVAI